MLETTEEAVAHREPEQQKVLETTEEAVAHREQEQQEVLEAAEDVVAHREQQVPQQIEVTVDTLEKVVVKNFLGQKKEQKQPPDEVQIDKKEKEQANEGPAGEEPRAGDMCGELTSTEIDDLASAAGLVFTFPARWFFDVHRAEGDERARLLTQTKQRWQAAAGSGGGAMIVWLPHANGGHWVYAMVAADTTWQVWDSARSPTMEKRLQRLARVLGVPQPTFMTSFQQVRGSSDCGIFALGQAYQQQKQAVTVRRKQEHRPITLRGARAALVRWQGHGEVADMIVANVLRNVFDERNEDATGGSDFTASDKRNEQCQQFGVGSHVLVRWRWRNPAPGQSTADFSWAGTVTKTNEIVYSMQTEANSGVRVLRGEGSLKNQRAHRVGSWLSLGEVSLRGCLFPCFCVLPFPFLPPHHREFFGKKSGSS